MSRSAPESREPETTGEALGQRNANPTEEVALGIRRRVFEHTIRNNGGYLSQACSAAEQLAWLYNEELRIGELTLPLVPEPFGGVPSAANTAYHSGAGYNGPAKPEYDRLIIAPAHYALVTYATLVEVGRMAPEGLKCLTGRSSVEMIGAEHCPGMEVHNGTLGVGLSTAAGLAWGRRRNGDSGRVWVFMSDGEVEEGQTWEAVQAAAYHGIDTLSAIVDVNAQQCDGAMASVMDVRCIKTKFEAFGAIVAEINGHDLGEMRDAAKTSHPGQPLIILAHTSPYQGMRHLEKRFPHLHYVRFASEEDRAATNVAIAAELGVPPVAYAH